MPQAITPIPLKIAYIGGGSRQWARSLMFDLALCPDLTGEVWLYDIEMESARLNERFGNWMQGQPGVLSKWRYIAEPTLDKTLQGADFVVISIQPGTLEVMGQNIAIAARYGMHYPVGDTTGAPGLMRGLFSAIVYAGFARAIAEHCPNAWIINYTNPMTMCTRTLTKVAPGLKVFGCCHEIFGTQELLAELVAQHWHEHPARAEIEVNVIGINHFTWIDRAIYKGRDVLALARHHLEQPGALHVFTRAELLERVRAEARERSDRMYANREISEEELQAAGSFVALHQVKYELLRRFGILGAAGDRHLAEFVPGFTRSPEELARWGILMTPVSMRIRRWKDAPLRTQSIMEGKQPFVIEHSGEEGVQQITSLLGLGNLMTNVNVPNVGQITNLPLGAVVETNAYFSRDSVRPITAGALPAGVLSLVSRHVSNQEMIIEAALTGDKDLAFQAIFNDPTTTAPIDDAWAMFNEMLQASRAYLPGWKM